jgi:hypothetical protein
MTDVLAEMLDWLAQHGLGGPTETGDLMQRAYDALAAWEARVEALERASRAVLGQTVNGLPIAEAECMCGGGGICPFHVLEAALAAGEPQQDPDEA